MRIRATLISAIKSGSRLASSLVSAWILTTGAWNDEGLWIDDETWNDGV